jgi:hypothetical protein
VALSARYGYGSWWSRLQNGLRGNKMALNPKNRKLDKRGNPIVTKEELEASGMSLRDFLNKERGLTKRVTTSDRIKNDETRKRNTAPVTRAETDARVMAGEKRKRDSAPISRGNVQRDTTEGEAAARASRT